MLSRLGMSPGSFRPHSISGIKWSGGRGRAQPALSKPDAASCGKQQLDIHTRMVGPTPSARAVQLGRRGRAWAPASSGEGCSSALELGVVCIGREKGGLMNTQPDPESQVSSRRPLGLRQPHPYSLVTFRGSVEAAPMGSHVPRSSSLGSGLQCGSGRMAGMHRIGQVPEMGEEDSIMKNPGYNSRKVETTEEQIHKS